MFSERIKALAKYIDKTDKVVDVGCDHGYLCIYLKQNKLCKEVIASDISENALNYAINNFKKYNYDIKTFVSDGFEKVKGKFDTAVIAGMGTSTILKIISHKKTPQKLILGSHNDLYKLRLNLNKMGYSIKNETAVFENNHYYIIMKCLKGKQRLSKSKLKYGICNNKDYYEYLITKNKRILHKVPFTKKVKLMVENRVLTNLLKKCGTI